MGVYGLKNCMHERVAGGVMKVQLDEEIKSFQEQNENKKPILVFDTMTLVSLLTKSYAETLCGGRNQIYARILNKLFTRLKDLGAELVFFLDGFIQDSKIATWSRRQNEKYQDSLRVMNLVYSGTSFSDIIKSSCKIYSNVVLGLVESVCAMHGQLFYTVNEECDLELATFAHNEPRVLAVFSNDSDFLIFPGHWRYFCTTDLDVETLSTIEYNRKALKSFLGLNDSQMAIFATVSGNDIVLKKDIHKFQKRISPSKSYKTDSLEVADYVKMVCERHPNQISLLRNLSQDIFGNVNQTKIDLLSTSIDSYNVSRGIKKLDGLDAELINQHHVFTYNVLKCHPINFSLVFFDLRQCDFPSYAELAVPMFKRQAGIVNSHSSDKNVKLKVYTKVSHNENYTQLIEEPVFPPLYVPLLEELYGDNEDLDEHRFELLKWTINYEKLKKFDLQNVPKKYLVEVLTLVHLMQQGVLTSKEADIFLSTSINVENEKQPKTIKQLKFLDPRAFRLVHLYLRMYANVMRSLEVCGLKKRFGKPLNFDGVYFLKEYQRYKSKPFHICNILMGLT